MLRALISQYVRSGEPVGSKTLVDKFGLGVSSATVRNDMAALEEGFTGLVAEDSGVEDSGGWGGMTLAHNVGSPQEVDAVMETVSHRVVAAEPRFDRPRISDHLLRARSSCLALVRAVGAHGARREHAGGAGR